MIKKLLIFSLVFVGMFTLSACDKDDGPADLEKLGEAMADLDIALEVSADITFVTTGLHDVEITWESSDTDVIAIDGTVTRPLFTEGDANITVTAYLSLGDQTLTKAFTVKVLKIANISEAEQVEEAKGSLLLTVADLVTGDITLPATVVKDDFTATVTWTSGNTALVTDAGVVTRPAETASNTLVVMTATITVGAASSTKTFEVMIKAEEAAASFASIALLHAGSALYDIVEFQGIVVALFDGGYFLTDGTNSIGIYNTASTLDIVVGDEVYVKGTYAVYYSLYQIGSVSTETIISSDNTVTLAPVVKTVAEMLALDTTDKLIHGMPYTVTGTVTVIGDYGNLYLVTGDDELLIYYYSLETSLDALELEVGKDVIITVFYYTDHSSNGPMVVFDGLAADIDYRELTPAEKLAADIAAADSFVINIAIDDVVLPTVGPNGSTYTNWTSDTLAVFGNDGVFAALGAETVTVTFTADVTQGTLDVGTTTIEVVVPVISTIAEALAMEVGDELEVTGVIYDVMYYGIFIVENDNYIFVYGKDFKDDVEVGDTVTVRGYRGEYSGLAQISFLEYDLEDTDVAPFAATVMSLGNLSNGLVPKGTVATITATYTIVEGTYIDYVLTDSAGNVFEVYYRSNVDELTAFDGKIITLDVVYYNNYNVLFSGVAADVTEETAFTDAQVVEDILAWIVIEDVMAAQDDLDLPATHDVLTTAVITWATSDALIVEADGTIHRIIGEDQPAVLTASVTYGTVTVAVDRDIDVLVLDENYEVASITVAAAIDTDEYEVVVVKGIVTSIFGTDYVVLQDQAGGPGIAIYSDDFNIDNDEIVVGDEIIVRGTHEIYYTGVQELEDVELIRVVSTGNSVNVFTGVTVAQLVTDMESDTFAFQGQNFIFTGLTIVDLAYDTVTWRDYVVVEDSNNNQIMFDIRDIPYSSILEVGDVLELSVVGWDVYNGGVRVVVTGYPEITDAEKALAAGNALDIPAITMTDLVLPTTNEVFGATISWASDIPGTIAVDGTVVRPAEGEDDAAVVLTATVTVGTEEVIVTINVTVPAIVVAQPLFFSEYGEPDGGSCKYVEIYNPTAVAIDLSYYKIINAYNGNAWDYTNVIQYGYILQLSGTINPGETFVIYNGDCVAEDGESQNATISSTLFPTDLVSGLENSSSAMGFNGDDTIGLFFEDTLIDVIGQIEVDPGTNWPVGDGDLLGGETRNVIMVRVPSVISGETDWAVGAMQWIVSTDDRDYSTVGSHTTD